MFMVELVQGGVYAFLAYYLVMHKLESVPIIGRFLKKASPAAEPAVKPNPELEELDKMIGGEEE